jgi:hypothetical protein
MFRRISVAMFLFCAFLFAVAIQAQTAGLNEVVPGETFSVQPSGSDTVAWSSGKYLTKRRNGQYRIARGFEVTDTSAGGLIKLHLLNDFDAAGRKVYLTYKIPASSGSIQRIGMIFDEVDSAGTTISKKDLIIWY